MPWMVAMFGVLVIPLGIVSIVLVILQPVMVGEWCALCLATAALMLMMIPLAVDEVAAMLQFLSAAVREGQPLWRTFWIGGTLQMHNHPSTIEAKDRDSPGGNSAGHGADRHRSLAESVRAMVRGVTTPCNLLAVAVLGLWVMAAPDAVGDSGRLATSSHIAVAVATTIAVVASARGGSPCGAARECGHRALDSDRAVAAGRHDAGRTVEWRHSRAAHRAARTPAGGDPGALTDRDSVKRNVPAAVACT